MDDIRELKERVMALESEMESLKMNYSIPLEFAQSFNERFLKGAIKDAETSVKSATSENQDVNEAGSGSYSVLGPPVAFIQFSVQGTLRAIPVYNV